MAGTKHDVGKPRVDLIDPQFILGLAKVMTMGAEKYGNYNWQGEELTVDRVHAANLRHLLAWASGEREDQESGLHHLLHAAANCMMAWWKDTQGAAPVDKNLRETLSTLGLSKLQQEMLLALSAKELG